MTEIIEFFMEKWTKFVIFFLKQWNVLKMVETEIFLTNLKDC